MRILPMLLALLSSRKVKLFNNFVARFGLLMQKLLPFF
eukprot:UN08665